MNADPLLFTELAPAPDGAPAVVVDPWHFVQAQWRPESAAHDETLFALASGALGVRGGLEESPSPTQATFLAGAWERVPIHYHERHTGFASHTDTRVPVADATAIRIRLGEQTDIDGAPGIIADPAFGECLTFKRTLDLHRGELARLLRWRTAQGHSFEVRAQRIVSFAHPGLLCIRWVLRSLDYTGAVTLESCIFGARAAAAQGDDPRFGAGAGLALHTTHRAADTHTAWLAQRTQKSDISIVCAQTHLVEGANFIGAKTDANGARQSFRAQLEPGAEIIVEKLIAYAWTQPHSLQNDVELYTNTRNTLHIALAQGFDTLAAAQGGAVDTFWDNADLAIDADDIAQGKRDERALRFNLFHVFQSANRDGSGGIAAKGLTGEGYEGHVFWDAETFVLPTLAYTAPALLKPSLIWRFRALDHARAHAREMGHAHGALYPWRTIAGDECSAHYPSGSAQYHINAAIAFAIKLYVEASGDQAFLAEAGAEMLFETARIWLEIGHFNARRGGAFCIHDVTGPDEYTALVDNNYYTNRMAQMHLRFAVAVQRELAADSPDSYAVLVKKIALSEDEVMAWSRAAEAMYLPVDEHLHIVAQDDTFLDKPLWDFAGTPPEKYPLLMHYHPLTLYRHQVCKQADALLALVLAGDGIDIALKRRSFDYYEAITVHDSTLSASTFAVFAAEVGYADKALHYFHETLRVDLDDLHANSDHGAHMAAMAGSWLALVWGFGGLRVNNGQIGFNPILPPGWRSYRFGIVWRGRRLRVAVRDANVQYSLLEGSPLHVAHAGGRFELRSDAAQTYPLRSVERTTQRAAFPRPFKALIFDLDGVLADTAHVHQAAWQRLADELGLSWDDAVGEKLKGVDRMTSLDIVLGAAAKNYTSVQKQELATRKNGYYHIAIKKFSANDLLPGALAAITNARAAGLKIALASSSRSAGELAKRLGIAGHFDHIVDAATITRAKPDAEIFLRAAAELNVSPSECLGIEDAQAGIAAIKAAGMAALGIGDPHVLATADAVLPDLTQFRLEDFVSPGNRKFARHHGAQPHQQNRAK